MDTINILTTAELFPLSTCLQCGQEISFSYAGNMELPPALLSQKGQAILPVQAEKETHL